MTTRSRSDTVNVCIIGGGNGVVRWLAGFTFGSWQLHPNKQKGIERDGEEVTDNVPSRLGGMWKEAKH